MFYILILRWDVEFYFGKIFHFFKILCHFCIVDFSSIYLCNKFLNRSLSTWLTVSSMVKCVMEGKGEMTGKVIHLSQNASSLRTGALSCSLLYLQNQEHLLNEWMLCLSGLTIVIVAQRNFHWWCRNPPLESGSHIQYHWLVQE